MLSKDVSTNFRDRGMEIRVWPLSFSELLDYRKGVESAVVWEEYLRYGGMPGAVIEKGRQERRQHEIDFVVNSQSGKAYVQSAFSLDGEGKEEQEKLSLKHGEDFFSRIIVTSGFEEPWTDDDGILHVGVIPFLLDSSVLSGALKQKGER